MKKNKDYNDVNPYSEFKPLPAGGYICEIKKVEERKNKNGGDMIAVMLDIIEGDYADYFTDLYIMRREKSNEPKEVKYPNDGVAYINVLDQNGNTNRRFKAFCTSIEESGGYVWNEEDEFMADDIKGACIGVIFRREQHEYNGKMYWNTKPYGFRSVDTIHEGDYTVPDDKYAESQNMSDLDPTGKFSEVEEDIPFI